MVGGCCELSTSVHHLVDRLGQEARHAKKSSLARSTAWRKRTSSRYALRETKRARAAKNGTEKHEPAQET